MNRYFCLLMVLPLVGEAGLGDNGSKNKPKASLGSQKLQRDAVVKTVQAKGTLEPEEVVEVVSQVAGVIVKFGTDPQDPKKTVDYGTQVKAGTILA